jgi:hypothetical protein
MLPVASSSSPKMMCCTTRECWASCHLVGSSHWPISSFRRLAYWTCLVMSSSHINFHLREHISSISAEFL